MKKILLASLISLQTLSMTGSVAFAQANVGAEVPIVDPVKVAEAERAALAIVPEGTMARFADAMTEIMDEQFMNSMFAGFEGMSVADMIAPFGIDYDEEKLAVLQKVPMREFMLAMDPYFEKRMGLLMSAMFEEMKPLYIQMEPGVRRGLALRMAKDYSLEELQQLNAFFDTPAGRRFAADSLLIFVRPEVMGEVQKLMPEMMKKMPQIMASMKDKLAEYPDPKDDPKATKKRLDALLEKYRDK